MSILPSRKVTAAFIAVFLIGTLVGVFSTIDYLQMQNDAKLSLFMKRTNDPVSMAARINQKYATDYQLTPDEQSRIAPLTKEMAEHLYQVRHQFGVDIVATLNDYHEKIGEQMTPEHRAAYEKANEDRKTRMNALLQLDTNAPDQGQK